MLFGSFFSRTSRSVLAKTRRITRKRRNNYDHDSSNIEKQALSTKEYNKRFNFISCGGIFLILLLCYVGKYLEFTGPDKQQCRPIWMYPSYARIDGFDTRFTPLAHKYHLYLYREQGKDKEPLNGNEIQLDGIPVLFIPGNAGSFKQSRSIAAESANIYFESKDILDNRINTRNLDFFTADFNEDFTAFHGQTMMDQAEYLNDAIAYILSLYEEAQSYDMPLPESVIVVAHSMGGIVTRLMMTLENHIPGSINTVLTLSSPHAASPVTFDGDILKIYKQMDSYWASQFDDSDSFFSKNVSLISITGGISDEILPADYASIADLIPPENGFSTFTTTIPGVWTPIDHLAVVWCKQLRHVIAKLLLEMVDSTSHSKTKPLSERIRISRTHLLSLLEDYATEYSPLHNPEQFNKNMDVTYESGVNILEGKIHLNIDDNNYDLEPEYNKLMIPLADGKIDNWAFNYLTSVHEPTVLFCKKAPILGSPKNIRCISASDDLVTVPRSTAATYSPADSSWEEESTPFQMLTAPGTLLKNFDFIIVQKPKKNDPNDSIFLYASLSNDHNTETKNTTPLDILMRDQTLSLSSGPGLSTKTWEFPNLWNSLISYQIIVSSNVTENTQMFEPFLRQATFEPFETKWYVNIKNMKKLGITMHNVAPFIPVDETQTRLLSFSLTVPANTTLKLNVKIDWLLTLKLLFIRYRLAIASFLATFMSIILSYQFYNFKSSNKFISFQLATSIILKRYGVALLIISVILSPIVNLKPVQKVLYFMDPVGLNDPFIAEEYNIYNNYYYLGIRDFMSSFIGLLFTVMTIAVFFLLGKVANILEYIIAKILSYKNRAIDRRIDGNNERLFNKKRIIGCFILILSVIFYIPYQLAFMLMVLLQAVTCIRIVAYQNYNTRNNVEELKNLKNYNISILIFYIIVSIINGPIIIVFFHNVAIKWETTFRSHHNILAVLPVVLCVIANSKFRIPTYKKSIDWYILCGLSLYIAWFSIIYGVRNLFWIHHLANILSGWLFYGCLNI